MCPVLPLGEDKPSIQAQHRGIQHFSPCCPRFLLYNPLYRQTSGLHRRPLPALMEGLSPIADQTEASFDTQDGGDLGFPGFDVSNSSPGDPQRNIDEAHSSPVLESEPQAYLR